MLKWGDFKGMERASKLLRGMGLQAETVDVERIACRAWAGSVGRKIARHTRAVRMVRTRLIVEVEDHLWQRQLNTLSRQILGVLAKNVGQGVVEDVEFRGVPAKREPRKALVAAPAVADESAGILDPVLRTLYRANRRKAQA